MVGNLVATDVTGTRALPSNILAVDGRTIAHGGIGISGPNNQIGGTTPAERNIISGARDIGLGLNSPAGSGNNGAQRNTVHGNYIGTDPTGTFAIPSGTGLSLGAVTFENVIGGSNPGEGNVISGNTGSGLSNSNGNDVKILGNWIGLDATGRAALPNRRGMFVSFLDVQIGGLEPGEGNYISGNEAEGIWFSGDGNRCNVLGNQIGLDIDGNPMPNGDDGILIGEAERNRIEGNTIAHNLGSGIAVEREASRNTFTKNEIFGNRGLGIDLASDGHTEGDANDADVGPNGLQNAPVITAVNRAGGQVTVQGTLT